MAADRILVDSSVFIDFFRKKNKDKTVLYRLFQRNANLFISSLTVYELLCGAKTPNLKKDTEKLLTTVSTIAFGADEANIASQLYYDLKSKNQLVGPIDILIAATAIYHALPIATCNKEHFNRFNDLVLI